MNRTTKRTSDSSDENVLRDAHVPSIAGISITGFLQAKAGHRVTRTITTTNVANDTETFTFSDSGTVLLVIDTVYTDGTRVDFLYSENNTPS